MPTTRLIGLEEHVVWPEVLDHWSRSQARWPDLSWAASSHGEPGRRLAEIGADRIAAMDRTGLDAQVLSLSTPGLQNLDPADALELQQRSNDALAEVVRDRPDRFGGFDTLATTAPGGAAAELGRAVTDLGLDGAMIFSRTRGRPADDPALWPVYEVAEALRAPLYLHPTTPPAAVRADCYDGLGDDAVSAALATHCVGWHFDTGVQLLRLILSGVFDRFPELQIIVGHWGELVAFYLERLAPLEQVARLPRPLVDYFRTQVHVTPSGMLSTRYLMWTVDVLGADRIMFSTDYPFEVASREGARDFLDQAPLNDRTRDLIAHGNWDRLRGGIRR